MNTKTLNIALPTELVKKVDQVAKKEYRNRSELIREALRVYLDDKKDWVEIFKLGEKVAQETEIKNEEDVAKLVYEYRHSHKQS